VQSGLSPSVGPHAAKTISTAEVKRGRRSRTDTSRVLLTGAAAEGYCVRFASFKTVGIGQCRGQDQRRESKCCEQLTDGDNWRHGVLCRGLG